MIAPRDKAPVLWGLEYSRAKASEYLPLFDLWPVRYATSYEYVPGEHCPAPLPPDDPGFRDCYRPVGDFPDSVLRRFERQVPASRLVSLGRVEPAKIFDLIAQLGKKKARVGGIGNIGGLGHEILEFVSRERGTAC